LTTSANYGLQKSIDSGSVLDSASGK